jgi:hypothetical protein
MSKLETPLTRRFWQETGGTLVEEFLAVPGRPGHGKRLLDGVIILDQPTARVPAKSVSLEGKDIIVIQAKASRLGMYLLGQAVFSARLMERFHPASIRSVAICTKGDAVLEPLAREYGVEVVIYPAAHQVLPDNASLQYG